MSELRPIAHCRFAAVVLVLPICPALRRVAAQTAPAMAPAPPAPAQQAAPAATRAPAAAPPQFAPAAEQLVIGAASEKDHQRLVDLVGIKALCPAVTDGDNAFRQHSGGHMPGPNWPTFLAFAGRYLHGAGTTKSTDDTWLNGR